MGEGYYQNGTEWDFKQAVKWYRLSANQGNANAQYQLGRCYFIGEGVEQDVREAIKWFRLLANQKSLPMHRYYEWILAHFQTQEDGY